MANTPYAHYAPRATEAQWDACFEHLAQCGIVLDACEAAGVPRQSFYRRRLNDPAFAERAQAALDAYADALEREAFRRGVKGVEKGIWYKGERVGSETEFSDTLLLEALRAKKPQEYRRNTSVELAGPGGKPLDAGNMLDTARRVAFAVAMGLQLAQQQQQQQQAPGEVADPEEFV